MSHTFPRWKYYFLGFVLLVSVIYALPNLYGEVPVVQVTGLKGRKVDFQTQEQVEEALTRANLTWQAISIEQPDTLLVQFQNPDNQLKAKEIIRQKLGDSFSVALNLKPVTPTWLRALGATPMKLGLDLRGGVHFLMEVDVEMALTRRMDDYYIQIPKTLREEKIRYSRLEQEGEQFSIGFSEEALRDEAYAFLRRTQRELLFVPIERGEAFFLNVELSVATIQEIRRETVEQTLAILRNRVNELGVAEAVVQRQGLNRVIVELPGIQDTAYAKNILGKTATLKFLIEDPKHDAEKVLKGKSIIGSKIYFDRFQHAVLLKTQPILTGGAITGASAAQDQNGAPSVSVRLGGDISHFTKVTRANIGKRMAVVYVEIKEGKTVEDVISVAVIRDVLGSSFQITGLSVSESRDLALLLRAGALPAPISIVEESIVGPSMGQENIRMGVVSVSAGLTLVLIFMTLYYSLFGMFANLALVMNLVLLLAVMSLIGATLTLPGIAGIVLTLGMAVDANVLIFERIREELRGGMSARASIQRGFEFAFATIIDSNLTTLIVGVVLFAIGTGPVKGFAVTLCIGILTSLLTAIMGTRAMVEMVYGNKRIRKLRVGI